MVDNQVIDEHVQLGWKVPLEVRENFTKFSNKTGTLIQEDCAGALMIWPYLPAEVREQAKLAAKGLVEVEPAFWEDFRSGVRMALRGQTNTQLKTQGKKK